MPLEMPYCSVIGQIKSEPYESKSRPHDWKMHASMYARTGECWARFNRAAGGTIAGPAYFIRSAGTRRTLVSHGGCLRSRIGNPTTPVISDRIAYTDPSRDLDPVSTQAICVRRIVE